MERFLLFIREKETDDVADFHPSEPAARKALVAYARRRHREMGRPAPINDDVAVSSYFDETAAAYTIARATPLYDRGEG